MPGEEEELEVWDWTGRVYSQVLLFTTCVISGKLLNLSGMVFSIEDRNHNNHSKGFTVIKWYQTVVGAIHRTNADEVPRPCEQHCQPE